MRLKMETTRPELSPVLADIAKRYFGRPTLEARNSDSLDFLDVAVGTLRASLEEAFEAGRKSRENER